MWDKYIRSTCNKQEKYLLKSYVIVVNRLNNIVIISDVTNCHYNNKINIIISVIISVINKYN